ncbi:sugar transferase [Glaesserella parasuis]|uniref:sugar transferase n=2 Tax=Glaesserella parasuis TaxID=738 RepID=UPI0021BD03C9|nr:sugar transferase [Glaesserella parasuis]MCT8838025.1 sugar transferase [Glaesserella parasuis]MDE3986314.1 sugar transferase [Glaesserella parasuis]MDG6264749.1 sugar transferase [Glaesserella parasuis]MDG6290122.1 sugar transferase [Glaesserella parasuis]MDG6369036.1 sugar transferase [Glaesserella parasuis]
MRNLKRHIALTEKLFPNVLFQIILIFTLNVLFPIICFGENNWWNNGNITIFSLVLSQCIILVLFRILMHYPGNRSVGFIPSSVISVYGCLILFLAIFRLNYSSLFLISSFFMSLLSGFVLYFVTIRFSKKRIAIIPLGNIQNLEKTTTVDWIKLEKPDLSEKTYDAIVVDLYSEDLTEEWQKFLAETALMNIKIYNAKNLEESLTGRVRSRYFYENDLGTLQPSGIYQIIKRVIDVIAVLVTLPITVCIMLITAIAIRLESKGNVLFIQKRVGQGGKEFNLYKFRSMCQDSEKDGAKFATTNDMRITKVGKFIRKTRIDELPQFFNVLKGDMSLIGPRPEQKVFVDKFIKEIPFYNYRHIVKPGISGWAQVIQGYTADVNDTKIKLQYDLYYIKNFSIWLDILIVFKTIKTMLTGFGAR